MMKSQEQSILSQTAESLPLRPPPIHAGQLSYPLYKVTKSLKEKGRPLPFNSSACKNSSYFCSEAASQVVGYAGIYSRGESNQFEVEKAAFGTS